MQLNTGNPEQLSNVWDENPHDTLSNAVNSYVDFYIDTLSKASSNLNSERNRQGPLWKLFKWPRVAKLEDTEYIAQMNLERAEQLKLAILAHAQEYSTTDISNASFKQKFKFRMNFLKVIFSLPSWDSDQDQLLRSAFEKFLSERKLLDISHF